MHKPTSTTKKLVLAKETVKKLTDRELGQIAGGKLSSWGSCICSSSVFENDDCPLGSGAY